MHVHIAIFKWKEHVTRQQVEVALSKVRSVASDVAGIVGIYCGPNTSKWAMGFTDGVVVLGSSADAIDAYRNHPTHQEVAKEIDEMELEGIGFDFADET